MKKILAITLIHFSFSIFICFAQQPGWEIISSGTNTQLNSVFFYDYGVGFACGDSGLVIISIDSGKTWQTLQTPVITDFNDLFVFNDSTLIVVGDTGTTIFSLEGGDNWYLGNFLSEDYYAVSFSDVNGILVGSSQTIVRAEFGGTLITFYGVQSGLFGGGFWGAQMISPQIGFVAGQNSIFQPLIGRTTDGGLNWNFTAFYLNSNEGRATGIDFTDINIGYVSASVWNGQGAIAKSTDSGSSWSSTLFPEPLWDIDFPISGASQVGYAVGSDGTILKTYDAGNDWQSQQSGTTLKLNKVHFLDLDFGFAVGENGIILRTTTGGEPVTQVDESALTVNEFKLEQNYPNPFNPSTKIRFSIPAVVASGAKQSQLVTLKVYDILGNEVATLIKEELPSGEYEVEFSPEFHIKYLVSGVYFYQLRASNYVVTKKMILLK